MRHSQLSIKSVLESLDQEIGNESNSPGGHVHLLKKVVVLAPLPYLHDVHYCRVLAAAAVLYGPALRVGQEIEVIA